ncbi:MAG: hypothetical protein UU71_C0012G0027 [Parcubacteria group bacterium GW2011_GWB1_41_6]|nr:MAG: hypothetical protein UU71_C0012G0027 [Parcubacteria group bacterium GW2011_GWB1_41_6]KKS34430.1 MAG: hypothetical protein UU96_C0004G0011 [Parcubacteria group bacterium GW2011_GWC2_42_13]KKS58249.1 MAG: hypothetical protein UV22_C0002G0012 [Parcubacteria group bacterium GW2011_GWA2_42_35]
MKKVMLLALVVLFLSVSVASAAEKIRVFEDGDKGEFFLRGREDFEVAVGGDFAVMNPLPQGGKAGHFSCRIGPDTVVSIVNRKINRDNLDLLSGKQVLAWGKIKSIGEGEGAKQLCLSLNIFILPQPER